MHHTLSEELLEALQSGTGGVTGNRIVALIMLHGLVSNPYTRGEKTGALVRAAYKLADQFFKADELIREAEAPPQEDTSAI